LERAHREFGFHIVHAHHAYLPGYVAVCWGRRHNIPVAVSCQGGDISERTRYLKRWVTRRRIIWALEHADAVTAVSKHLAQRVSILTDNRIAAQVIPNGVEMMDGNSLPDAVPGVFSHLENRTFILTLGRLHPVKGLDLLLDAIKVLKNQNTTVPILAICGDGREKNRLLQQVQINNLADRVTFVGEVSGSKKAWLLANCSFLVQPSRDEGLANSVLEAMSYGKAVLATAVGGLPELVTSGKNGLLVEADNPTALAGGLRKMLSTDLSSYGQNALRVAREYSCEKTAELHLGVYQSLVPC